MSQVLGLWKGDVLQILNGLMDNNGEIEVVLLEVKVVREIGWCRNRRFEIIVEILVLSFQKKSVQRWINVEARVKLLWDISLRGVFLDEI